MEVSYDKGYREKGPYHVCMQGLPIENPELRIKFCRFIQDRKLTIIKFCFYQDRWEIDGSCFR